MRRGISELNGEGEAVGGVIVMRYGENASEVISKVKDKLEDLQRSCRMVLKSSPLTTVLR